MPRAIHNIGRQRSTRNAISINAMLTWRGKRLRSVRLKEGDEAANLADIAAIDRVLVNVLGYTGDIEAESKDFRREALFKRNELRKAVMVVLREANEPLTTRQITERVMSTKGKTLKPRRLSKEWISRVRVVCRKMDGVTETIADGMQVWARSVD